jgi:hypothetical protein
MLDSEWLSTFVKMIPFIVSLLGVFFAYIIHSEFSVSNVVTFRTFLTSFFFKIFNQSFFVWGILGLRNLYIFLNRK